MSDRKRNLWDADETRAMLNIMIEQNYLSLFDGKTYKREELYKKIKEELCKCGYDGKNERQIETRWKNLKRNYWAAKKNYNAKSGERELCPFYEELEVLLLANGVDNGKSCYYYFNCVIIFNVC